LKIKKLKLLILIRPFGRMYAKHKSKYDFITTIEQFADVYYWHKDGSIHEIIKKLNIRPDFIFHYDTAYNYKLSPRITGLSEIDIPKGCYIIDSHYNPGFRREYVNKNKIDVIFSVTKENFLKMYPDLKNRFIWLPWSINTAIFRDWSQPKVYDFMLMGLVNPVLEGRYPFREKVLETMKKYNGFVHHHHPGHLVSWKGNPLVDLNYAKEINKSKIFFTCGSTLNYPVLKYFEVLACNSLLLAEANNDIYELGFSNGVNFIACTKEDFEEKALYYLNNPTLRNRISKNGANFINRYHSNEVRASQFIKYINEIIIDRKRTRFD